MIVIADANIIVSALIKPKGIIASIFKEKSGVQFIAPDYLLVEIYEHWGKISKFSTLSKIELIRELAFYKNKITFVSFDEIPKKHRLKAYEVVKDIDVDDAPFIALHLHKKHKIWTGDKPLITNMTAKGYKIFITTAELRQKLYKK